MKVRLAFFLLTTILLALPLARGQSNQRVAVLAAGGPAHEQEQKVVNDLTTNLVNETGIQVVNRQQLQQVLDEMKLEHSLWIGQDPSGVTRAGPTFDSTTAAKLGHLLGVPALIFVRVDDVRATKNPVRNGTKTTVYGNVALKVTSQVLEVDTAAIISAPTASFSRENQLLSESDAGKPPTHYGPIPVPGRPPTQGPDPDIALRKIIDQAYESVVEELSPKISKAISSAPAFVAPQKQPKVAGVQQGMTFLNVGSNSGIKVGAVFQITRTVDSGMQDPDTHQPIMRKKQICKLTISEVEDSLSSGNCKGEVAQNGDVAIPAAQ